MSTFKIEQLTLPYKKEKLVKWKDRDPSIVPSFMLDWNGPGISNGYGFGEWMADRYFRDKGYYTITNEFNLLSNTSKFRKYNEIIAAMIDPQKLLKFKSMVHTLTNKNYPIENPDMFVYNLENSFFAEVKKERDVLREPQIRFIYLAKTILNVETKLIYLSDSELIQPQKTIQVETDIIDFTK